MENEIIAYSYIYVCVYQPYRNIGSNNVINVTKTSIQMLSPNKWFVIIQMELFWSVFKWSILILIPLSFPYTRSLSHIDILTNLVHPQSLILRLLPDYYYYSWYHPSFAFCSDLYCILSTSKGVFDLLLLHVHLCNSNSNK